MVGSDDLGLATALNDLALVMERQSKRDEVEALYRESLAIRRKRLGNDSPSVAQSLNNIALLYVVPKESGSSGAAASRGPRDQSQGIWRSASRGD